MNKKVLYRIYQAVLLTLYIGLMVFFVVMCLQNGTKSSQSSARVAEATAEVINTVSGTEKVDPQSPSFQQFVRKFIGHYGYFIALGLVSIFFWLSIKELKHYFRIIPHFSIGIIFAIISEFWLEGTTDGRGPSWKDVGLDTLGFLTLSLFVILGYYLILIYKKKKSNKNEEIEGTVKK